MEGERHYDRFLSSYSCGSTISLNLPLLHGGNSSLGAITLVFDLFFFIHGLTSADPVSARLSGSRYSGNKLDQHGPGEIQKLWQEEYKEEREDKEEEDTDTWEATWEWQQAWVWSWVESQLSWAGVGGRDCVERFMCELQQRSLIHPHQHHNTILGTTLALLLTPLNSSSDSRSGPMQRYWSAQEVGRSLANSEGDCGRVFPKCPVSLLSMLPWSPALNTPSYSQ